VVFLLRRIPRGPDDDQQRELELLGKYSHPEQPFMVTKEAVGALALLNLPQAEKVLIDRLTSFEYAAIDGSLPYAPEEVLEILRIRTEPDYFWSIMCEVGFVGWIACTVGFIFFVFTGDRGFRVKRALVWGALIIIFYAVWIVGMLRA